MKIIMLLFMLGTFASSSNIRAIYTNGSHEWIDYSVGTHGVDNTKQSRLELYQSLGYNTIFDWISPTMHNAEWIRIHGVLHLDKQSRNRILETIKQRYEKCAALGITYQAHYFSWGHGSREQKISADTKYVRQEKRHAPDVQDISVSYVGEKESVYDVFEWLGDEITIGTQSEDWYLHFIRTPEINYERHIDPFRSDAIEIFTEMTGLIAEFYRTNSIPVDYYFINSDEAPVPLDIIDDIDSSFGKYFAGVLLSRTAIIDSVFAENPPKKIFFWCDMVTPIGTFFDYYNQYKSSEAFAYLDSNRFVPTLWLYAQHFVEFSDSNFTVANGDDRTFEQRITQTVAQLDTAGFDFAYTFATDFDVTGGGVFPVEDNTVQTIFSTIPILGNLSHVVAWGYAFSAWKKYRRPVRIEAQNEAAKKVYQLIGNHPKRFADFYTFWGSEYDYRVNGLLLQSYYGWNEGDSMPVLYDQDSNLVLDYLE